MNAFFGQGLTSSKWFVSPPEGPSSRLIGVFLSAGVLMGRIEKPTLADEDFSDTFQ